MSDNKQEKVTYFVHSQQLFKCFFTFSNYDKTTFENERVLFKVLSAQN